MNKRNPWQKHRCLACDELFRSTRIDTVTCSPACRKALSRWIKKHHGRTPNYGEMARVRELWPRGVD